MGCLHDSMTPLHMYYAPCFVLVEHSVGPNNA